MSARRKSLFANEISSFETDIIDDEAEKRQRFSERVDNQGSAVQRNRRRTIVPDEILAQGNKVVANGNTPQIPKPSNEQLSCLYNNCVKLLNENKINAKNAFQLKLIDYMSEIVLNKEIVGGVTNFQVVGCTIDVGTKIYAARVDALHQNTYQVLSGLGNSGGDNDDKNDENNMNNNHNDDANNDLDDQDDRQNNKKGKTKKKRMKKSSQIAQNVDTITSKMKDEFKDEDLYFAKISTSIENEAIAGILLNKLHVQNDSNKILINADDQKYANSNDFVNNETEICCQSIYDIYSTSGSDLRNIRLCADLNSFRFVDWNLENDDISRLVEDMHNASDHQLEEHRFDANNKQSHNLEIISDVGSTPMDNDLEDFGGDFDGVGDIDHIEMFSNGNDAAKVIEAQHKSGLDLLEKIDDIHFANSVSDLTSLISHTPSEYSYFNFDKLKLQTLPKHLKQIAAYLASNAENSSAGENNSANSQKAITVRNKRQMPLIDLLGKIDRMKFFKITKKAICLCDKTIEKRSEKAFRLETERQIDYNAKRLLQPYHKIIPAKVFCDIENVDNLLINDDNIVDLSNENHRHMNKNREAPIEDDDDDGHLGGMDDNFEIPCTALTNEPFYSENGGEFAFQTQFNTNGDALNDIDNILMPPPAPNCDIMNLDLMSRFDGENLIQAPLQVNALNIEYAKTSKNIDVRRLKQIIWSLISNNDNKENDIETSRNDSMDISKQKNVENKINASLKVIYSQLKPPVVSQRVYDDLSICIVFQMILFLANEHNLLLENDPDGSDVQITN